MDFSSFSISNIENKFHQVENFLAEKIHPSQSAPTNTRLSNDSVNINKYNTSSNISNRPGVSFSQVNQLTGINKNQSVDSIISNINQIQDPNARSAKLRDLMINLIDDSDFVGAIKTINATPSLVYRNAMFKGLVQELASSHDYNSAINLINQYSDERVKNEMRAYVSYYANNSDNDSTIAASVDGDKSMTHVAKLKAENIMGSVSNFFSSVEHSVLSPFTHSTTADKMAEGANKIVGKQYRAAYLDYGNKACAYSVSQMIKGIPGLEGVGSAECNMLAKQLQQKGFTKAYSNGFSSIKGKIDYKPGDIVFFVRNNKDGYGHVGMVSEVRNGIPYMVNNSSSKREVVKIRLDQYYKVPVAVFRAPNR